MGFCVRHAAFFKDHVIDELKGYYSFNPVHAPDHWFQPVQVWEVKSANISVSPVHKAPLGLADPGKGVSLRSYKSKCPLFILPSSLELTMFEPRLKFFKFNT